MDKFKLNFNKDAAKTAIKINIITPAKDSYSATSRNSLHGAHPLADREKSAFLLF